MACLPDTSSCNPTKCNLNIDENNDLSNTYDTFEKPIRVINLEKTLEEKKGIHFLKPKDWKFHVLSHTWSRSIRKWSEDIGDRIGAHTGEDKDAYNSAFEKENFTLKASDSECYKHLLEIFEMLQADGAKLIWIDALCINQTSGAEKSHEINNMGAYFSLSTGTYVLTHGVDKVNGLWEKSVGDLLYGPGDLPCESGDLPRWFTRVWTFQEFLLPKQLSFLVEGGVDQKFVAMVNCLIHKKKKTSTGFCKCFLNMQSEEVDEILMQSFKEEDLKWMGGFELRNPKWKSFAQLIKERAPPCASSDTSHDAQTWLSGPTHYGYQDMCSKCDNKTDKKYQRDLLHEKIHRNADHPNGGTLWDMKSFEYGESITCCNMKICKECGSRPMIRSAKVREVLRREKGHEEPTYFMDREVFLGLMQCHSRMVYEEGAQDKNAIPTKGIQALRGLYCAWATEGNWKPCHVICEVGWRHCSVEEDRVLGILGLLGLSLKQLRTDKSLKEQVLELAKVGGSAMLVELCVMNQKGGRLPGMSWAPDFHGLNHKLEYASRPRIVSMHVDRLESDGQLKVKVKMACGRVEPIDTNPIKDGQGFQYRLILHNSIYDDQVENSSEKICLSLSRAEVTTRIVQEEKPRKILHFDFKQDEKIQVSGSFEVPISIAHKLDGGVSFLVRLLLLGEDEVRQNLLLICLPDKLSSQYKPNPHEKLHKVGSIAIKDMPLALQSIFDSSNLHPCVIGAFGEDLTEYIQFQ